MPDYISVLTRREEAGTPAVGERLMNPRNRFPWNTPAGGEDPQIVSAGEAQKEWSALECARTLFRNRKTLAWMSGLGLLTALLVSALQPRLYQAQTALEIQGVNDNFLNLREVYPTVTGGGVTDAVFMQTQADLLQDNTLLEKSRRETSPGVAARIYGRSPACGTGCCRSPPARRPTREPRPSTPSAAISPSSRCAAAASSISSTRRAIRNSPPRSRTRSRSRTSTRTSKCGNAPPAKRTTR